MRTREDSRPFAIAILVLIVAIFVSLEAYMLREPSRVAAEEMRDREAAIANGEPLYADNCAMCHGEQGEGVDGPPLNDSTFLRSTPDTRILSVIRSGVPGSEMPAWSQDFGGPFTDEQMRQIVVFLRSWEATAPDRAAEAMKGDPQEGLAIFSATCVVCHGIEGQGTDKGPALHDTARLAKFDDQWYADTISDGRPAAGMPTWGTVLSPVQIRDLVALLRAWERGETVELPGPGELLHEAGHQLGHGDLPAVRALLEQASERASGELKDAIEEAAAAAEAGDADTLQQALDRAVALAAETGGMAGMDMGEGESAAAPGETEARSALADLVDGDADAALPKLKVALVLATGALKEAVEHAIADIEAGKAEEARDVLQGFLQAMP